jgi:hypothetical protein
MFKPCASSRLVVPAAIMNRSSLTASMRKRPDNQRRARLPGQTHKGKIPIV